MLEVYADVGRNAAGIAMRLVRAEQNRESQRDRDTLAAIAKVLVQFSGGEVHLQSEEPLLSSIDGLFVLLTAIKERPQFFRATGMRDRIKELAGTITEVIDPANWNCRSERAARLQYVFREAHDFAEEVTVVGLRKNPVSEVFNALG